MAVTGQFGRAVTGSGSLASAISSAASEYAQIRITRIYNAFLNEEVFEGRVMNGKTAIELLKQMQKRASKNSRTGVELSDTINDIRKGDRNRTINRINAQINAGGFAGGDYYKKVQTIREMLLDPSLSSDDRSELESDLSEAVNNFLTNARNQYGDGSSITVNGQTVDFAGGANSATLMGYYEQFINDMPSMAATLTREKFKTQAAIYVSEGVAAYNSGTRATDAQKKSGYQAQLVYYKKAYDLLVQNGMKDDELAETILGNIRTIEGNISTVTQNIAGEAADKRYSNAADDVYGFLNDLESAIIAAVPSAADYLGESSLSAMLRVNPNAALNFIEAYKSGTGMDTIEVDGQSFGLSVDDLTAYMMDAKAEAKDLYTWSKGSALTPSRKADIRDLYTQAVTLANNAPRLKAEDAYDNAQDELTIALDKAGSNFADRAAAVKAYATQLNRIANLYGKNDPNLRRVLGNEANLFLGNGNFDSTIGVYGTDSLNYGDFLRDTTGISQAIGGTEKDITLIDALNSFWDKVDAYNGGEGDGTDEGGSSLNPEDMEDYSDGNGIRLVGSRPRDVGDGEVLTSENTWYKRYRIMVPGFRAGTGKDDVIANTLGWVTVINGQYLVTATRGQDGNEYVVSSEIAQELFANGITLTTWNGMTVVAASSNTITSDNVDINGKTIKEILAGAEGQTITQTQISGGGESLRGALDDAGYGWIYTNAAQAQYESLLDAVRNGYVLFTTRGAGNGRNGRFSVQMDDGTIVDISSEFSTDTWKIINDNILQFSMKPEDIGEGPNNSGGTSTSGEVDPKTQPWAGTQWEGKKGTDVIGKDANGNDLTLEQAFSGGTGYMWATPPKTTGGGGVGRPAGAGRISPATKAKLDAASGRTPIARGEFLNRLGGGGVRIPDQDLSESRKIFNTVMRNMPAGTGGTKGNTGVITKTTTPAVKRRPLGRISF